MVEGALKAKFLVPQNRVAELVATSLPQCSWHVIHFNEEMKSCTADRQIDKGAGDPASIHRYTANIEWVLEQKDTYRIRMSVSEAQNKASQRECQQLCSDFFEKVKLNCQRLKENPLKEKSTYGSASWAEPSALIDAGYISEAAGIDPKAFIVGPYESGKLIAIPANHACMHTIVCGSTGTGKTSSFIIPQAVTRLGTSAIFTEATDGSEPPTVYTKTARWRHEQGGQDIYYFNPDDLASNQINLISTIKRPEDAVIIASLIVRNTVQTVHSGADPFWEQAETYLLNALLLHLAGCRGTLAQARYLVQQGPTALAEQLKESFYQAARDEYNGFLNTGNESTRSNVFIGLLQRLTPFCFPVVQKLTERTDIDFAGLRERLFSFYLAVPAEKVALQPVVALVLSYLLDVVVEADREDAPPLKHPLMLVLDEFTNFGKIANFQRKLALIRHREIGVTMGFQYIKQVAELYGHDAADTITSQAGTRIYLRPRDLQTAESISRQLGTRTHYERKVSSSGSIMEKELSVNLMPPGDVLALPFGEAILFTPATRPMKIKPFGYEDFKHATNLAPWQRRKLEAQRDLMPASDQLNPVESEPVSSRSQHDRLHDEKAPEF